MNRSQPLTVLALLGLTLLLDLHAASATCAHGERGMFATNQYIELIGQDPTSSAAIGAAAAMWNSCPQAGSGGIPQVWATMPPSAFTPYNVYYHDGLSPATDRCGILNNNRIDIYQRTLNSSTHSVMDCGTYGYGQNIAHEIGHIFGLADDFDAACQSEIMGQAGNNRSVQPDECGTADQLNSTYSDRHDGCWSLEDCRQSPILINLADDGYSLTGLADGVDFDIDGSGLPERVAWTTAGSEQAFLWLDNNGNGVVDSGWELFGDLRASNGFEALKVYDLPSNGGNGDGILDARDSIWPSLRLWIDSNHDGISQPWEIFTLQEKGIVAIGLDYTASNRKDAYGNLYRYGSLLAIKTDGEVRLRRFYDVYLLKE